MPIYYDLVNRPDPENTGDPQPLYPRVVCKGTVKLSDLLVDMSTKVDEATLVRVLTALRAAVCTELMRSRRVHIEGWGSFSLRLEGRPVDEPEDIHAQSISVAGINFQPEKAFVKACRQGDIVRDSEGFRTSADCPLSEQLALLANYFASHVELTTNEFVRLTGIRPTKARVALAELVERGYLARMGRLSATHYVRTEMPLE